LVALNSSPIIFPLATYADPRRSYFVCVSRYGNVVGIGQNFELVRSCWLVSRGAIFYGEPRRRIEVEFSPQLRARTETLIAEMHRLYQSRETPPAKPGNYCQNCSLVNICLPHATAESTIQTRWNRLQRQALQLPA